MSNFGVHYDIKEEYDKAIEMHKKALEIAPNEPLYHNNIAIVYAKKGNTKKAFYHWGRSLEINPEQPQTRDLMNRYKR